MPGNGSPRPRDPASAGGEAFGRGTRAPGEHRAQTLESLQSSLREMVRADDEPEICEIIVRTVQEVLSLPLAGVWLHEDNRARLRPLASSDPAEELFGDLPTYEEGSGLSWRVYETGETMVVNDTAEEDGILNAGTPVRSELVVPIGEHGVLNCGSTDLERFDGDDVALVNLLAENAAVALERADRERRLERQADQLEYFNSILRHEVLNGMTVIRSRGMRLFDVTTGEASEQATTIVSWCDEIAEVVSRVRTVLETMTGRDRSLTPVEAAQVISKTVNRIEQVNPAAEFVVELPDSMIVEADELLSDVIGAVVRNAVEHNDSNGLRVRVTADLTPDFARIDIADDGVGIDSDGEESIFRREGAGHAKETGSGFGLFFVDAVVTNYGGTVWAETNTDGGATFVIKLPRADPADHDS